MNLKQRHEQPKPIPLTPETAIQGMKIKKYFTFENRWQFGTLSIENIKDNKCYYILLDVTSSKFLIQNIHEVYVAEDKQD